MATRPIFVPRFDGPELVGEMMVEFQWFPGFSVQQKQRSIAALHAAAKEALNLKKLLEISTKSPEQTGVDLSAFNLMLDHPQLGRASSVEAAFQGSKVFENGMQYADLYAKAGREARRDPRLQTSGALQHFQFGEERWELEPKTAFYDWLYVQALGQQTQTAANLLAYEGFSDIEFNPKRSLNCQARAAALYVSLRERDMLADALSSVERYREIVTAG